MAETAIKNRKWEVWLPLYMRMVSHARRCEEVKRPLFPLYLFARFNAEKDDYGAILRMPGVHTILGIRRLPGKPVVMPRGKTPVTQDVTAGYYGDRMQPLAVPDIVIDELKAAAAENGGHVALEQPQPTRFEKGTPVVILDGALQGWTGLVDRDHHRRVRVLLDIVGRETPIVVPRESLARV